MTARIGSSGGRITLAEFPDLSAQEREVLTRTLGATFTFNDIDRVSPRLTKGDLAVVEGFRRGLIGEVRSDEPALIGKDGEAAATTVRALTLDRARAPEGEAAEVSKLRADMKNALIGHEQQVESFVRVLQDMKSKTRRFAPVLALVGGPAQGKEQALLGYVRATKGPSAVFRTVDLSRGGDNELMALFAQGGPLSKEGLAQIDQQGGMIRLRNSKDLATRAPRLSERLAAQLSTVQGDAEYVRVNYVFDFEEPSGANARDLMIGAVGWVGNANLSAVADFKDLDGPSMLKYALMMLPSLVAGLGNLKIEIDKKAREYLGEALATPHMPLVQLEQRLQQFVCTHFDRHTSVDGDADVLRVSVAPAFVDANAAKARIAELHQKTPDLALGSELFVVHRVADLTSDAAHKALLARAGKAREALEAMASGLPASASAAAKAVKAVAAELGEAARAAQGRRLSGPERLAIESAAAAAEKAPAMPRGLAALLTEVRAVAVGLAGAAP